MKRYPIRVAKYFIFLVLLYFIIYGLMIAMGATKIDPPMLKELLLSSTGLMMFGLVLALSLVHPLIGYVTREFTAETEGREVQILDVMRILGFESIKTEGDIITFKAIGFIKRMSMLFEDEIIYDTKAKTLTGNRKQVTIALFKIQSRLINN